MSTLCPNHWDEDQLATCSLVARHLVNIRPHERPPQAAFYRTILTGFAQDCWDMTTQDDPRQALEQIHAFLESWDAVSMICTSCYACAADRLILFIERSGRP